jgi:hypothetical protein
MADLWESTPRMGELMTNSVEMTFDIDQCAFEIGQNLRAKTHHPGRAIGET